MNLTIIGIILAFLAMVMIAIAGRSGNSKGAGILLIGPLPIIFGTDRQSVKLLVILAIILMLIVSTLTILPYLVR
jgi:uncharacterized protein (TIGR00304 family)